MQDEQQNIRIHHKRFDNIELLYMLTVYRLWMGFSPSQYVSPRRMEVTKQKRDRHRRGSRSILDI